MKKIIILLILLIPCYAFGQNKRLPGPPTKEETEIAEAHYKCLHTNRFDVAQRRSFYPFNTTKNIRIISFNDPKLDFNIIPVKHHNIIYDKVRESKKLSQPGIDSLTDILFNIGYTARNGTLEIADPGASCFNPRNAILFMDANGKVIEFIEYCFQCNHTVLSSKRIKDTEYCEQKYDILRRYFLTQGIKIGTILETR